MSHLRLDPSKLADVAPTMASLRQNFKRKYNSVDEHLLEESIEHAVLHYVADPDCFDASRGVPLPYYLWLWSRSYLDKRLRKNKRRRMHEKAVGVSEKEFEKIMSGNRGGTGIYLGKDENGQEIEEREEELERARSILDVIVPGLDPYNQAAVQLLRDGASGAEWVRRLGIEYLPRKRQQRRIDAEKDRLRKLLRRKAEKMREDELHSSTSS